jgi:hypothetical protein
MPLLLPDQRSQQHHLDMAMITPLLEWFLSLIEGDPLLACPQPYDLQRERS